MPRSRAQLSEKQERILVQCQLMGLTTRDMTQISNRLRVLDKERAFKKEVDLITEGFSWRKESKEHYVITAKNGRIYDCSLVKKNRGYRWETNIEWKISVSNPGTRMKERSYTEKIYGAEYEEVVSVCPDKDRVLYRLLRSIYKNGL